MSYIENNLIVGEQVVYEGRISLWSVSRALTAGLIGLPFILVGSKWALIPFFVAVACLAYVLVQYASNELAVTNKRVISKRGFVARQTVEISLSRVEGVEVHQTAAQRAMGYGNVFVSGTGSHRARIENVKDPMKFRQQFLEALDRYESSQHGAG
jgi:uncharacterized membrane protein YdbT with pleckstrin-like domain